MTIHSKSAASSLDHLRTQIDSIDDQIVRLLQDRFGLAQAIREAKASSGQGVYDPARENAIIQRLTQQLAAQQTALPAVALHSIYAAIMRESRSVQAQQQVAILGPEGSYHHVATLEALGSSQQVLFCGSITEAFVAVSEGLAGQALVAVENSLGGTIGETIDQLWSHDVRVVSEIILPIRHCLIGKGPLAQAKVLLSHPQALAQCSEWIRRNATHLTVQESASTSAAVEQALRNPQCVGIGSELAARLRRAPVLARDLQNSHDNQTRFYVLQSSRIPVSDDPQANRGALMFTLPHRAGALARALDTLAAHALNLTAIVSRPLAAAPWEYVFLLEVDSPDAAQYQAARAELERNAVHLRDLGRFARVQLRGQ